MHGTDPAIGHTADAPGNLVIYVAGGEHGALTTAVVGFIQPSLDPPLAIGQFSSYARFHSKALRASGFEVGCYSSALSEISFVQATSRTTRRQRLWIFRGIDPCAAPA